MPKTYFIRGTITIRVESGVPKVGVTPCAGFLTPEVRQRAIAFPKTDSNKNTRPNIAMLFKCDKKKNFECVAKNIKKFVPALLSIAGQHKLIDLLLIKSKKKAQKKKGNAKLRWKIVGFVYPTP